MGFLNRFARVSRVLVLVALPWSVFAAPQDPLALPEHFHTASQAYALGDYETAYRLFLPMGESGNVFAQFALGKIYRFGQGQAVDYAKALYWYELAANQSYGVAQSHYGEMLELGLGTPTNMQQAKYWFKQACDNRCSEGCKHLARLNAVG